MSKIRRAIVAIVAVAVVAVAVAAIASPSRHHPPAPAAAVRVITPAPVTPPASPAADFETDTFLNLLTHVDPAIATQLINALPPADRAALANQVETRTGLAAG